MANLHVARVFAYYHSATVFKYPSHVCVCLSPFHTSTDTPLYVCARMSVCLSVCRCVCIAYTHTYIYIYIYTYLDIRIHHTHTHTLKRKGPFRSGLDSPTRAGMHLAFFVPSSPVPALPESTTRQARQVCPQHPELCSEVQGDFV